MCAANVERTVSFWTAELKAANRALGHIDTKALQRYVEKVVVFSHANPGSDLGPDCSVFFAEYAGLLASQGRFDFALRYLKGSNQLENILIDRLYHAGNKVVGSRPPAFPFERINVTSGVAATAAVAARPAAAQAATVDPRKAQQAVGAQPAQQRGFAQHQPQQVQQQAQPVQPAAAAAAPGGVLPPGWVQGVDPASGRPYYFNQATNQSQWEPPALPPAPTLPVSTPSMPAAAPYQQQQQQYQPMPAVHAGPAVITTTPFLLSLLSNLTIPKK